MTKKGDSQSDFFLLKKIKWKESFWIEDFPVKI